MQKRREIFKEFHRLDQGARIARGLGLGLSIVERIARVLDHPIRLKSVVAKGSLFAVEIPTAAPLPAMAAQRQMVPTAGTPLIGMTILCIDNEPKILEGMALLITGWGCTVREAQSITALDEITRSGEPAPDIIIADYHLDDGDGIAAIQSLRAAYEADVPALLITADRSADVRNEAEKHGISLQHKPVRPAALRAYLTQIAGLRRLAAE